ncbi:MAG: AAA family ATPase [Phycisphaerales bacterium JB041]
MNLSLPSVECGSAPSSRLLRALAPFGLLASEAERPAPPPTPSTAVGRVLSLPGGSVALVTGPSGCGKTTLLRAVADATHARVVDAARLLQDAPGDRPVLDLITNPVSETLRALAAAGLAEPGLWARAVPELSEGQRSRLGLALAIACVRPGERALLVSDEFASTLDRVTARGVARTVRRWASRHPDVLVLCATAHEDLAPDLRPDAHLRPPFEETHYAAQR